MVDKTILESKLTALSAKLEKQVAATKSKYISQFVQVPFGPDHCMAWMRLGGEFTFVMRPGPCGNDTRVIDLPIKLRIEFMKSGVVQRIENELAKANRSLEEELDELISGDNRGEA